MYSIIIGYKCVRVKHGGGIFLGGPAVALVTPAGLDDRSQTCTVILYVCNEVMMATETTYTHARANLAALCDQAASSAEPVIIRRRGAADVALVGAAELRGLIETAHLLRSPKNAQRLLTALVRAREKHLPAQTVENLRREVGLGQGS